MENDVFKWKHAERILLIILTNEFTATRIFSTRITIVLLEHYLKLSAGGRSSTNDGRGRVLTAGSVGSLGCDWLGG